MAIDLAWNFAEATLVGTYSASATVFTVGAGQAARFPPVPFDALISNETAYPNPSDDPAREYVRVTAINVGNDQLTATRGQQTTLGGLAASAKDATGVYKIRRTFSAKDFEDIRGAAVDVGALTIYVTEKGAKGDGTTNDSTSIQNAVNAGNLIIFPPGTYMINPAIVLKSNLEIRGAGIGITTVKLLDSSGAESVFKVSTAVTRVTIRDITLDGNEANNPTALDGIALDAGGDHVTLDNVEIVNVRRKGITLGQTSGSVKHLVVHGCRVKNCRDHLLEVQNRNNDNVAVNFSDLILDTPGASGGSAKAGIVASGPVQASNITIEGVAGNNYGVFLRDDGDSSAGNGAHDSHFSNVHVKGTVHASDVCEGFRVNSDRCTFQGCTVNTCDINFRSGTSSSTGDDNTFFGCTCSGGDTGFRIEGDRNVIDGCKITGTPTLGIDYVSTADEGILRDNYITGTTKVTVSGTNLHARDNVGWVTNKQVESASIDVSSQTELEQTIAHGLSFTPSIGKLILSHYRSSGTGVFGTRGPYVKSVDGTNIVCSYNVTASAASTNAKLVVTIDEYP